jgi:hypothetical protein
MHNLQPLLVSRKETATDLSLTFFAGRANPVRIRGWRGWRGQAICVVALDCIRRRGGRWFDGRRETSGADASNPPQPATTPLAKQSYKTATTPLARTSVISSSGLQQ